MLRIYGMSHRQRGVQPTAEHSAWKIDNKAPPSGWGGVVGAHIALFQQKNRDDLAGPQVRVVHS